MTLRHCTAGFTLCYVFGFLGSLCFATADSSATCALDTPDSIPPGYTSHLQEDAAVNLYYVRRDNATGPTVLLLHGWPQNWASWYRVMRLFPASYDVIAINLRGVSPSDAPLRGYTKAVMAQDIRRLLKSLHTRKVHLVGHDIGGMVSYAFAVQFPKIALSLTIIDVPVPGTPTFDQINADPRAWHFGFNGAEEFPEALTTGRESFFYAKFMREVAGSPDALTPQEIRVSVNAYSVPSTARAGFEWYRAFAEDAKDNKEFAKRGKLTLPVLALNGAKLSPVPFVLFMMKELAQNVTGQAIDTGHWIPEEAPEQLVKLITDFLPVKH